MNFGKKQEKKPTIVYKVDWIGKEDPNIMFSKTFINGKEALEMAKSNSESVAYKMEKSDKDTIAWKMIPTVGSKEIVRSTKLKRKIRENKGFTTFFNADGIGEVTETTTTEYRQNQKSRILSTVVISSALIYAGTRKELQPVVRYSFIGLGILNALFNIHKYNLNNKI